MTKDWREKKQEDITKLTEQAQILVGAVIRSVEGAGHSEDCDGVNQIILTTNKGTFVLTGSYGGYTGNSCDEYYEKISIERVK